jgi:hypothetical protein
MVYPTKSYVLIIVGITTGFQLDEQGLEFESRQGRELSLCLWSKTALGPTQPPIQKLTRFLSPCVKRPESKAVHSTPTSTEVKRT